MRLPAMPVRSGRDATLNFDKLQAEATEFRNSVATAYRKAALKVPNNVVTKVAVDTVINDPGSHIVGGSYIVPVDGYYIVYGQVMLLVGALTGTVEVACIITINGVQRIFGDNDLSTIANTVVGVQASGIVLCKTGEAVELAVFQFDAALGAEREIQKELEARNRLHIIRVA